MRSRRLAFLAVPIAALALTPSALRHVRAARLLSQLSSDAHADVDESATHFGGNVPARLYRPRGIDHPPGLVLVHGVHHLGIEEPRMQRFARALAGAGIAVFTPQIDELADYRIDPASIETIGAATEAFARENGSRVGLMGLSFAGGLSLIAASEPRFAPHIAYVVAVGAHDDLERVSRFFALDEVALPDGSKKQLRAHPYGLLVLARTYVKQLFAPEDQDGAREALKLWLWQDYDGAHRRAAQLTDAGRKRVELLLADRIDTLRATLLDCIGKDGVTLKAVSPSAHLSTLTAPALLLHGAGDDVIPPSETLWLAKDVPAAALDEALVSPALQHVELEGEPGWVDKWHLIHFVAKLLAQADASK